MEHVSPPVAPTSLVIPPGRESCRDLATRLTTHKPVGIELLNRTVVDELPQDALLPPAPPSPLRPGARHQVQSPKIPGGPGNEIFVPTLIKKKTKLSSYKRKFRWDRVQRHI